MFTPFRQMSLAVCLVPFLLVTCNLVTCNASAAGRFEFESYKDIEKLFEEKGYTQETWQKGIREVPRLYLATIPERWRDKTTHEISVAAKKRIFFHTLAPLILRANEMILEDRARLEAIDAGTDSLTSGEREWFLNLAARHKVIGDDERTVGKEQIEELLARVDIIPPPLALAQAAEESGWGTSRFAVTGNALFGQRQGDRPGDRGITRRLLRARRSLCRIPHGYHYV